MRKIIYTRPDGGMSVVHPVINTFPIQENITEAQAEQRAWNRLPPEAIRPRFVEEIDLPSDRTFRNAWVDDGIRVSIKPERIVPISPILTAENLAAALVSKGILTAQELDVVKSGK